MRLCPWTVVPLLALLAPAPSLAQTAQDRAAARALAQQADEKAAAGQLAEATELFQKADALVPAPTLKLAAARLMAKRGLLVEALMLMQDAARSLPIALEPASWPRARTDARAEAADLEKRLCTLEIHLRGAPEGAQPRVTLNGDPLPQAALGVPRVVNPGSYVIAITLDGFKPAERKVELADGEKFRLTIPLEIAPKKPPSADPPPDDTPTASASPTSSPARPPRVAPSARGATPETQANQGLLWGGVAVATVFSLSGTVTGLLAMRKADELKNQCPDNRCPESLRDQGDRAKTFANLSTLSFVVAGGGVALSVVGLLLREEAPASARRVQVQVGWGAASLAGRF